MMNTARVISAVAAGAAALLALTACSGSPAPSDAPSTSAPSADPEKLSGTLEFVGSQAPEKYAAGIAAFEKAYPGVKVDYTQVPFDKYNAVLQQRLGAGDQTIDVSSR